MQVPEAYAIGTVRLSLGRGTTAVELERVLGLLPGLVTELRDSRSFRGHER